MKNKLTLIAALAAVITLFAFAPPARADVGIITPGITNTLATAATTTANLGNAIKVDRTVGPYAVEYRFNGGGVGTNTVVFNWVRSLDGINYEQDVTAVTVTNFNRAWRTNIQTIAESTIGSAAYIRLISATVSHANGAGTDISNVLVRVAIKK